MVLTFDEMLELAKKAVPGVPHDWNPLNDDVACAELAQRLQVQVAPGERRLVASVLLPEQLFNSNPAKPGPPTPGRATCNVSWPIGTDAEAARRAVIVLAAAHVGFELTEGLRQ